MPDGRRRRARDHVLHRPRSTRPRLARVAGEIVVARRRPGGPAPPTCSRRCAQTQLFRGGDAFGLNALNLIVPTPITRLGGWTYLGVSATFEDGNYVEAAGYISVPLLLALASSR